MSFYQCIVNIGTQCMKGGSTFFVHFGTSHLSSVQTTRYLHFDTFGSHSHSRCDSHFDSTTVSYLAFDLTSDITSYYFGIKLGAFYFVDIDLYVLIGNFLQFFFEFVYLLATFTDNKSRTSGTHGNGYQFQRTFYNYA